MTRRRAPATRAPIEVVSSASSRRPSDISRRRGRGSPTRLHFARAGVDRGRCQAKRRGARGEGREPPRSRRGVAMASANDWWQTGVVYQIYPRSFGDANGDGLGDLPGILEHLDHLNGAPGSLGIDAIWLSPIYPSPDFDFGYDVADYVGVDPRFGTDRRLRTPRRGVPCARHQGRPRPRPEPLQPPPPVVRRLAVEQVRAVRRLVHLARLARAHARAAGAGARTTGAASSAGPPGPGTRRASSSTCTRSSRAAGPQLAPSSRPHRAVRCRPHVAGSRRRRVPARRLQHVLQGRRASIEPAEARRPRRLGRPGAPPRPQPTGARGRPSGAARDRRRAARPDDRRRAVRRIRGGGRRYTEPRHLIFDWSLVGLPWSATAFAEAIAAARRGVRAGSLAGERALEPRSAAACQPVRRRSTRCGSLGDARAKLPACLLATLRGTPFLYYGEEMAHAQPGHPERHRLRPAGAAGERPVPVVEPRPGPRPDGLAVRVPAAASRPARRGSRFRPTSTAGTSRSEAADRDSVLAVVPPRAVASPGDAGAADAASRSSLDVGDRDVLAYRRGGGRPFGVRRPQLRVAAGDDQAPAGGAGLGWPSASTHDRAGTRSGR